MNLRRVSFFLLALTAVIECGHTHPIAEHEHPHEHDHHHTHQHDHTHESLTETPDDNKLEILRKELTGTYQLESVEIVWGNPWRYWDDNSGEEVVKWHVKTDGVRGKLAITPNDNKWVMSGEVKRELSGGGETVWQHLPLSGVWYCRVGASAMTLYPTEAHRIYDVAHYNEKRSLRYEWDGRVLNVAYRPNYVGSDFTVMKWRKV